MRREEAINRLRESSEKWDILIIGGGATGLGAAVEAASRGYRTALVEQHDFAKGTSSRSTKLIHGGVRYLKQGNIALVTEALRERSVLAFALLLVWTGMVGVFGVWVWLYSAFHNFRG